MDIKPYLLKETNWKAVKDQSFEVAVLPWGATEAHNYHLPYGTDVIQCDYVAELAARKSWKNGAKIIVLPTIPFGVNTGQFDIKLDINMMPSTQTAVLLDIAESLSRQGIRKLVVMNGHGGNDFKQIVREVGARYPNMFICYLNWYQAVDWNDYFDEPGDHAGEMETSTLLHIAPHLVLSLNEAGQGRTFPFAVRALQDGTVWAERKWSKATEDTGAGNPSKATADKGNHYLEAITDTMASFLSELADISPENLYMSPE